MKKTLYLSLAFVIVYGLSVSLFRVQSQEPVQQSSLPDRASEMRHMIQSARAAAPASDREGFPSASPAIPSVPSQTELAVDDGSFEDAIGLRNGGTIYAFNRLTPTSYPATLSAVTIYFRSDVSLSVGKSFTVLSGSSSTSDPIISNPAFQQTSVTVQSLGQFNVFTVPDLTINSGSFLVGFRMDIPSGVFPVSRDDTPPSRQRSYLSVDGATYVLMDLLGPSFATNFGIRARLGTGQPPCHTIANFSPTSGNPSTTVTLNGTNFTGVSTVRFTNGVAAQFNIINDSQITATVPAGAVTGPITIVKPGCPDVVTSSFTVTQTACTYAISPTSQSFTGGGGTGSVSVTASPNTCAWTATGNDSWIAINSGGSGTGNGTVNYSVAANTGSSARTGTLSIAGQTFTVNQAGGVSCQTVTGISPTSGAIGGQVTITGAGFTGVTIVRFASSVPATFNIVSDSEIRATVPTGAATGPITIVKPGCPDVRTGTFTVGNPQPTIGNISPSVVPPGGPGVTIAVTGGNFIPTSQVRRNGGGRFTTYVSSTELRALILPSDVGEEGVSGITVFNPAPGGGTSNSVDFTVANQIPAPVITSLNPSSASAGGTAFTLRVTGTNFVPGSIVRWNNADRSTSFVSATALDASIAASDIAATGTASVTVFNPAPGGGTSNALNFTIEPPPNPTPVLSSLSPNAASAGGPAFTLTINGSGFAGGAMARWNGADRATTFNSSTQLSAAILASDIATAGVASVTVFNPGPGGGTSNALNFTINQTARLVRAGATSGAPGGTVAVPIELVSQGDENALGFSLSFDPTLLGNPQAAPGSDAASAQFDANANQAAQGRLGLTIALPANQKFASGVRQLAVVTFTIAAGSASSSATVNFGDQPVAREVADANAGALPANYASGIVTFTPASGYEADVTPRPNGNNNGRVTITDVVQVGRFAAGLDTPDAGGEFQRADCAPRATAGDGRVTVADWTQAARFAAGLDPAAPAAGPTAPVPAVALSAAPPSAAERTREAGRTLRASLAEQRIGGLRTVALSLDALGGEHALGASLLFNPSEWRFVAAALGRDARAATLQLNDREAARGRIGIAMALPAGQGLEAGERELLLLRFAPVAAATRFAFGFGDAPVAREIADAEARLLATGFAVETDAPTLTNAAADGMLDRPVAGDEVVAAFGADLAVHTVSAESQPPGAELGGTRALLRDSQGREHEARLLSVSPSRVNYVVPTGIASGPATVVITSGDGRVLIGLIEIAVK